MSDILKLKYKVGEIEFEAEGPAEAVEQQRVNFMNVVLPAAVDAMVRTQAVIEHQPYIDAAAQPAMLEAGLPAEPLAIPNQLENDFPAAWRFVAVRGHSVRDMRCGFVLLWGG